MNPSPKSDEEWRVDFSERLTRLETKMNIIAYVAGTTLILVVGDIVRLMIVH